MQKRGVWLRILVVMAVAGSLAAFLLLGGQRYLSLEFLKAQKDAFSAYYQQNQMLTAGIYFAVYVISTALSFPGAAALTLLGGALFGLLWGTVIVSFASTLGATLAFLAARFVLRDYVQERFGDRLKSFNEGVRRDGAFYLFTLRLIPAVPFFVINLVMGLTPMAAAQYFWVSQMGMLPGTIAFVNAGTELAEIESLKGILSPGIIGAFVILSVLPLFIKSLLRSYQAHRLYRRFERPKKYDYNVVVIGAGAAGLVSAYISAAVKAKVAIIEKHKMGGDCLNFGCVPSKALIQSAKLAALCKRAPQLGFDSAKVDFKFSSIMERVQRVIKTIEPHDSIERYTKLGVECITGTAKIISPFVVEVNGRKLTTKNIVIASGAEPLVPAFQGLNQVRYATTDNVWDIREQPKRLLVLGGGPIGCELAQAFQRLGSQVCIVEKMPGLLIKEDPDVASQIEKKLKAEGVQVRTGHEAVRFQNKDGVQSLIVKCQGREEAIEFDLALFAIGRRPRTSGFGLEELGIELTPQKTIRVNEYLQTSFPNIYVCGDVAGPYQFTHTASHQAWYCAVNALFSPLRTYKVDYRVIPWCTFTDPEVARVGLNEVEAKEKNIRYEVTVYHIDDLDRAIADEEAHGMVKVLTVPGKDKILGATIVGSHAGELITEFIAAMKNNFGLNRILGTIHIYPTLSEANKYAAGNWKRAHAPEKALKYLQKFHAWRRS